MLRDYYREVELVQDLTYAGKHVDLRPFEKARECRQARDGLLEIFGKIAEDAFPFALDQAERTWAVVPSNAGERLVLFDLELATQAPKQLFAEWLADVISEAAVNAEGLIPKSKKRRYVQFTFSAHNEGDVFAAFGDAAEVRQLSSWEAEETSAAGVKTAQRRFVLSDELLCGLAGLHHGADVAAAAQERGADGGAHMDPLNVRSRHQSLHHFVADANWSDEQMLLGVCQWVVPLMDFSNGGWWIIDDTGFPKSGPRATKSR